MKKILWGIIIAYIIIFSFFSIWKYHNFYYNALDLAIFNQVFHNSSAGRLFEFTIHPHSYLGDHLALILILLLPLYWLFKTPYTLLIVQTICLALAAWPLYLIARKWLRPRLALLVSCLFLLSPFTHNINLFEFHLISLALPLLFFLFYLYLEKRFIPFLIILPVLVLIREDLALIVLAFFLLALVEKRRIKWWLPPLLLGSAWLVISYQLTTHFSGYATYKFLTYFSWLGQTPSEMFINFFAQPLNTLLHIFSWENFILLVGLFVPFIFIPLLKPKYLILSLPHFILFILAGFGKVVILKSHYLVFLTFGLWLCLIVGLKHLQSTNNSFWKLFRQTKPLLPVILIAITVYSAVTFGPFWGMIKRTITNPDQSQIALQRQLADSIPAEASLLASYNTITNLSARTNLYLNRYLFLDIKQYSDQSYPLPENIDYAYLDSRDFLIYQLQYSHHDNYQGGAGRIRQYLADQELETKECLDSLLVLAKGAHSAKQPYQVLDISQVVEKKRPVVMGQKIELLSHEMGSINDGILPLSFFWQAKEKLDTDYQLYLEYLDDQGQVLAAKLYAMAYGLLPTSDWPDDTAVKTNYWLLLSPDIINQIKNIRVSLVTFSANFSPSDILSGEIRDLEITGLEPKVTLPLL
ncbi:MAG: DUF2079 domain-containing protein [Patescibacteria group bacterium]